MRPSNTPTAHRWSSLAGDELGEIAVTDKADFTLSSNGQLCCLMDLFLLCFPFTSFIFFLFLFRT